MQSYDVIIIGAGPGGYVAAEEAADKGNSVAVIERKAIGGTCLNVGCIPSKAYLQHSHWVLEAETASQNGIEINVESVDFPKLVERKNQVVATLQKGIQSTFKSKGIEYIEGEATYIENTTFSVNGNKITGKNVLLATGGRPFIPEIPGLHEVNYLTTDTFFEMEELPEKLIIIGGGVIATELAFAMQPLGVNVTILEVASDILLTEEEEARNLIKRKLKQMGLEIITAAEIENITSEEVKLADGKNYSFDQLLVATGRRANLELPEAMGLTLSSDDKFVEVDEYYETSQPHVYAIGDAIPGYSLAHSASAEGIKAIRAMNDEKELPVSQNEIPRSLYTQPEVASFGMSEEQAKAAGYDVVSRQMPMSFNGRAMAQADTDGFVKIISEEKYGEILGAVIVGEHATDLLHSLLTTQKSEGTVHEVAQTVYAHPTLSELIQDTAKQIIKK